MKNEILIQPDVVGMLAGGQFVDQNGATCSIQESSPATEPGLWLGIDAPGHRMLLSQEMAEALLVHLTQFTKTGRRE